MKKFYLSLFFTVRFYTALSISIAAFMLGFAWPTFFALGKILLLATTAVTVFEIVILYASRIGFLAGRKVNERFSNGDFNEVTIDCENRYAFPVLISIIDEVPVQFQVRDFLWKTKIDSRKKKHVHYSLRPTRRGEYVFGSLFVFVSSWIFFVQRRYDFNDKKAISVYPSFIQLRKYELIAISDRLTEFGIKKIRKIGHNLEFDQIREYIPGDDFRDLNWKATARKGTLMVNQYQDERSQQVYCIVDKGRAMKMPFEGMSLLDYAINSSLVLSRIALVKSDKPGLITFSNRIGSIVKASSNHSQMNVIMESLYKEDTRFQESDFGRLYRNVKTNIKQRSLILLYTNFESEIALQRQLPYLRRIAKDHLLVVVFFLNTELDKVATGDVKTMEDVFIKTIAEKFVYEKKIIMKELTKYGIHTVLTQPQHLTVSAINKYLELKSRGMI